MKKIFLIIVAVMSVFIFQNNIHAKLIHLPDLGNFSGTLNIESFEGLSADNNLAVDGGYMFIPLSGYILPSGVQLIGVNIAQYDDEGLAVGDTILGEANYNIPDIGYLEPNSYNTIPSGTAFITDSIDVPGAGLRFTFPHDVSMAGLYCAGPSNLTIRAYNASGALLDSHAVNATTDLSGWAQNFIGISTPGIRRIEFYTPNQYWIGDDLTYSTSPPTAVGTPVPTNQSAWNYASIVNPIKENNPKDCKPFAVGDLSSGNLSLQVGLPAFSQGVDVYLAIGFADALFLVDDANVLHPASELTVLPRWKTNVSAAINEALYGDISTSLLPSGVYNLYTLVVPTGETDFSHFYFWSTNFSINH